MKANPDKCHLLTSSSDKVIICVDNDNINLLTFVFIYLILG